MCVKPPAWWWWRWSRWPVCGPPSSNITHYLRLTDYKLFHTTHSEWSEMMMIVRKGQFWNPNLWRIFWRKTKYFFFARLFWPLLLALGFTPVKTSFTFYFGRKSLHSPRYVEKSKKRFLQNSLWVENLWANLSPFFSHPSAYTQPTPKLQGSWGRSTNLIENMTHELLHLTLCVSHQRKRRRIFKRRRRSFD